MRSGKLRHTKKAKSTWHRMGTVSPTAVSPTAVSPSAVSPTALSPAAGTCGRGSPPPLADAGHGDSLVVITEHPRDPGARPHLAGGEAGVLVQAQHRVRLDGLEGEEAVAELWREDRQVGLCRGGLLRLPARAPAPCLRPAPLTCLLPWMMVRGTVVWGHFLLGGGGFLQLHSTTICRGEDRCLLGSLLQPRPSQNHLTAVWTRINPQVVPPPPRRAGDTALPTQR